MNREPDVGRVQGFQRGGFDGFQRCVLRNRCVREKKNGDNYRNDMRQPESAFHGLLHVLRENSANISLIKTPFFGNQAVN